MKKFLFALTAALFVMALGVSADEPVIERHVKLKIVTDAGEPLDLDLSDMEEGDTRQFFTDNNVEVTVTRLADAFEIQVDGEDEPLTISVPHGDHHGDFDYDIDCDGDDCDQHVFVHKIMHGDGGAIFHGDDGHRVVIKEHTGDMVWVGDDEGEGHSNVRIHRIGGDSAARLLESGALDDLSPEKREEILDALRGPHGAHGATVKVIKRKSADGDE